MRTARLEDMTKGWFVGNFTPSLFRTNAAEVAVKCYKKGETEKAHYHKIATEITVVINGSVRMFDQTFAEGDIIVVEPLDITMFEALEDTVNVVVKIPGANDDKYMAKE